MPPLPFPNALPPLAAAPGLQPSADAILGRLQVCSILNVLVRGDHLYIITVDITGLAAIPTCRYWQSATYSNTRQFKDKFLPNHPPQHTCSVPKRLDPALITLHAVVL